MHLLTSLNHCDRIIAIEFDSRDFLCGHRDIVLEIEKYAYYRSSRDKMPIIIREKMPIIYNFFLLLPGIYIEIGIDWN